MQTCKLNYHYYSYSIVSKLHIHKYILHFLLSVIHYDGVLILYLFNQLRIVIYPAGQKFREVFQLKRGSYSDLPASKISEMMHSSSLDVSSSRILPKIIELCYPAIWYPCLNCINLLTECTDAVTY